MDEQELTPRDYGDIVNKELTAERWTRIVQTAIDQASAGNTDARNWLCNFSTITGSSCDHEHHICNDCASECSEPDEDDYLENGYHNQN